MRTIKQLLVTVAVLLCSATANAHDFEVDGIYYNIISASDLTAAVTYKGNSYNEISNEYSGEVIIPETVVYKSKVLKVTSIASRAFCDCNELTSIEIPNSVAFIGFYAFKGCNNLTSVNIKDIAAWCNIDIDYDSGVGGHYESNPLYYANNLYLNREKVTELVIPNSVTCIRGATFYGCTSLTSVTFGNNLTRIEQAAFRNCSGLTSIEIPNTMTNIEESTFSYCSGLTSVMIPNNITSIGNYAFEGCRSLTSVVIPNSVTSIGDNAFSYCTGLTSIVIGNNVTSIGKSAFSNCSGLKKAEFNCSEIQDWFSESSIEEIVIGNSVASIESGAFKGCTSLKKLRIEDGTETLSLGYIIIYGANKSYKGVFYNCPLETIYLGRNISYDNNKITHGYFSQGNDALTSVTIGNNVTRIRGDEFSRNSNLASIVIGNSVESIGDYAFNGCSGVTNIHLLGETPPTVGRTNFTQSQYTDITIYVPTGTLATYQAADTWKNFWDIKEFYIDKYFYIRYFVDNVLFETDSIKHGAEIKLLDEPTKEGYTFSGWSEAPETMPAKDISIEGTFYVNNYTVTYIIDGEVYEEATVEYGAEIELPSVPEKEGYTFSWMNEIPKTMPAKDIVIHGSYVADTAIEEIYLDLENIEVYNLRGLRITETDKLVRGIYIINGKKTFVK